tara:strand:+ start:105 stop:1238 length:1134 start_codon:yes stop_codon:yes gene_type:complete
MTSRLFILAGEASGDALAAQLMNAVGKVKGPVAWSGMGGPQMKEAGLTSSEEMGQLSIIGISDALAALPRLYQLADRLIDQILDTRPDIVFTVDSKAFSVRFAKRLRKRLNGGSWQPQLIHMVAPTIWAWGEWRKKVFEQTFDGLLCLFPFEPELFDQTQLQVKFIGHPLTDLPLQTTPIDSCSYDFTLMPGSRRIEVKYHLPLMLTAFKKLQDKYSHLSAILPAVPHLFGMISEQVSAAGLGRMVAVLQIPAKEALSQSKAVIAASGTATLEAALSGVPGVVIYHLTPLNRLFTKLFFKRATPVLPDLIMNSQHYPFLLPPKLNADTLYYEAAQLMDELEQRHADMEAQAKQLYNNLKVGEGQFSENLATCLKSML